MSTPPISSGCSPSVTMAAKDWPVANRTGGDSAHRRLGPRPSRMSRCSPFFFHTANRPTVSLTFRLKPSKPRACSTRSSLRYRDLFLVKPGSWYGCLKPDTSALRRASSFGSNRSRSPWTKERAGPSPISCGRGTGEKPAAGRASLSTSRGAQSEGRPRSGTNPEAPGGLLGDSAQPAEVQGQQRDEEASRPRPVEPPSGRGTAHEGPRLGNGRRPR